MTYSACVVNTDARFHYNAATRTIIAEISELRGVGLFGRLFDDACDVGVRLRSIRTGQIKNFTLVEEQTDAEGDTVAWHYRSDNAVGRPEEIKLVIFND